MPPERSGQVRTLNSGVLPMRMQVRPANIGTEEHETAPPPPRLAQSRKSAVTAAIPSCLAGGAGKEGPMNFLPTTQAADHADQTDLTSLPQQPTSFEPDADAGYDQRTRFETEAIPYMRRLYPEA